MAQKARTQIKFADDLVLPILNGQKEATIRYDGFESVDVGDKLIATTTEGKQFAELRVRRTANIQAVESHSFLEVIGAGYSSDSPQDVIDTLNKYYDDSIKPGTIVQILVFDFVDRLDVNTNKL